MMTTLIEQYKLHNHFGAFLGMHFKELEPGVIHYFLKIRKEHLSTPKAVHGGVTSALMDATLGLSAASAVAPDKKVVSTVEFKLNFLSPAFLDDELMGIGHIEQLGKRLVIVSGDIICTNRNNIVIAKGMGTFNTYPAEKAGFTV